MYSLPAPYEPAGRPVRMDMKQTVTVRSHLYFNDQLNLPITQYASSYARKIVRTGSQGHLGRSTKRPPLPFHPLCKCGCFLPFLGCVLIQDRQSGVLDVYQHADNTALSNEIPALSPSSLMEDIFEECSGYGLGEARMDSALPQ